MKMGTDFDLRECQQGFEIWEPLEESEGWAFLGIIIPKMRETEDERFMTSEELAAVIVAATSTCSYWPKV